jgi:hypothetical protein
LFQERLKRISATLHKRTLGVDRYETIPKVSDDLTKRISQVYNMCIKPKKVEKEQIAQNKQETNKQMVEREIPKISFQQRMVNIANRLDKRTLSLHQYQSLPDRTLLDQRVWEVYDTYIVKKSASLVAITGEQESKEFQNSQEGPVPMDETGEESPVPDGRLLRLEQIVAIVNAPYAIILMKKLPRHQQRQILKMPPFKRANFGSHFRDIENIAAYLPNYEKNFTIPDLKKDYPLLPKDKDEAKDGDKIYTYRFPFSLIDEEMIEKEEDNVFTLGYEGEIEEATLIKQYILKNYKIKRKETLICNFYMMQEQNRSNLCYAISYDLLQDYRIYRAQELENNPEMYLKDIADNWINSKAGILTMKQRTLNRLYNTMVEKEQEHGRKFHQEAMPTVNWTYEYMKEMTDEAITSERKHIRKLREDANANNVSKIKYRGREMSEEEEEKLNADSTWDDLRTELISPGTTADIKITLHYSIEADGKKLYETQHVDALQVKLHLLHHQFNGPVEREHIPRNGNLCRTRHIIGLNPGMIFDKQGNFHGPFISDECARDIITGQSVMWANYVKMSFQSKHKLVTDGDVACSNGIRVYRDGRIIYPHTFMTMNGDAVIFVGSDDNHYAHHMVLLAFNGIPNKDDRFPENSKWKVSTIFETDHCSALRVDPEYCNLRPMDASSNLLEQNKLKENIFKFFYLRKRVDKKVFNGLEFLQNLTRDFTTSYFLHLEEEFREQNDPFFLRKKKKEYYEKRNEVIDDDDDDDDDDDEEEIE